MPIAGFTRTVRDEYSRRGKAADRKRFAGARPRRGSVVVRVVSKGLPLAALCAAFKNRFPSFFFLNDPQNRFDKRANDNKPLFFFWSSY